MRELLILLALLSQVRIPGPGGAAPAVVGPTIAITSAVCAHTSAGHNFDTCNLGASAAVGDLQILMSKTDSTSAVATVAFTYGGTAACTPTQTVAPTFQANGSGKFNYAQAACIVTAAGVASPIATWSGAGVDNGYTEIQAFTVHTSTSWKTTFLDQAQTNVATSASTSCPTGTTAATTTTTDWILATCSVFNVSQTQQPLTGYTSLTTVSTGVVVNYGQSIISTGAQSANITLSGADFGLGSIVAYASN